MRTIKFIYLSIAMMIWTTASAQEASSSEKYSNTLNVGIGAGYYGYIGHSVPVFNANFEFGVAKNFTLAPFIMYLSYQNNYYWGNKNHPERYYNYHVNEIPIGVKASYYFDQLLHANSKWDFYAAASLGFAIRNTVWESGYYGETDINHSSSGLYLDIHIGSELHLNKNLGLFLDLSTGISTFGLAVHF